jgi:hypothetical protein
MSQTHSHSHSSVVSIDSQSCSQRDLVLSGLTGICVSFGESVTRRLSSEYGFDYDTALSFLNLRDVSQTSVGDVCKCKCLVGKVGDKLSRKTSADAKVKSKAKVLGKVDSDEEYEIEVEVKVKEWTHDGEKYWKSDLNNVYDIKTQEHIGMWNEDTNTIEIVVLVKAWTHDGKKYLKSTLNKVYDFKTRTPIGMWNEVTNTIEPLDAESDEDEEWQTEEEWEDVDE